MEQSDGNVCPLCQSRMQLYDINLEESVKLCSNSTCIYPFGHRELEYYDVNGVLVCDSSDYLNSSEFLSSSSGSFDPDFWLDDFDDNIQTVSQPQIKDNDETLFFEKPVIPHIVDKKNGGNGSHSDIVCLSSDTSSEVENVFLLNKPKRTYSNVNRIKDPKYVKNLKMINVMYGKNVLK